MNKNITNTIASRRTFAIISHPDAGKTTLTEKLLLFGGAIHLAGAVKAKTNQRHTTSDWMEIERQRGISVSSSVLQFEYEGHKINLLDTPGHKDFSEDTYRTLMAADAAVMLIDAAKGVEAQTKKLFEVCCMRKIPIFTFINKCDRPSQDPFVLLDELEKTLNIQSYPMNWPIGLGDQFIGIYSRKDQQIHLFEKGEHAHVRYKNESNIFDQQDYEQFKKIVASKAHTSLWDEADIHIRFETLLKDTELLDTAGEPFSIEKILQGTLTPVFFGSAMNNFGVQNFLEHFVHYAPAPSPRHSNIGLIAPEEPTFSCFVFKIQANMDAAHRDRIAFLRICSGKFERNMQAMHMRLNTTIKCSTPLQLFAQERVIVDEAYPGDIIGLLDTSQQLRIGDTLCSGDKKFAYESIPRFYPEYFARIQLLDPLKRKQLKKGIGQLSEEGVVQIYTHPTFGDQELIVAGVGALQLEVLDHRLKNEYGVACRLQPLDYQIARWPTNNSWEKTFFVHRSDATLMVDQDDNYVLLFKSEWALRWAKDQFPKMLLSNTAPLSSMKK